MLNILYIGIFTFVSWGIILFLLAISKNLGRFYFISLHYLLDVLIFGFFFFIYYKYLVKFTPFSTMAIAMIWLIVLEFIFWKFIYKGDLWFLNWVDWIVPAFLVASTIYLVYYLK